MEVYRTFHGPFPGCPSYLVLQKMYRIALPKLLVDDPAHASLEDLLERDSKMFFPGGALKALLDESTIRDVLSCSGEGCCGHAREKNLSNFEVLLTWVFNHARTLLAILIYLGHSTWINTFRERSIDDENLDRVITFINNQVQQPAGLSRGFAKSFEKTLDLFRPPVFVMGNPKFTYGDNQRFPYIDDQPCGKGSFGHVYKFVIHPDYLDKTLAKIAAKYCPPSVLTRNSANPPARFARKVLKYTTGESEFDMEEQVLRIIDAQCHDNIIDLVAFYSWRGQFNCIFPFVELTLYDVLHQDWKPESMAAPARFPTHWLWQQMILVADALKTIHNPPLQLRPDLGTIVGFHFDLKPKNILVTPDGTLKITDFGQSMVKMVDKKESAYGIFVGGDFAYGPPEVAPTRNEIKDLVIPPGLQSSQQLSDPPTPPSSVSRSTSVSASRFGSHDSGRQSTAQSLQSATGAFRNFSLKRTDSIATSNFAPSSTSSDVPRITVKANYDVWSLACIMTEVLTFIFEGGADAVRAFESLRQGERRDLSFHNGSQDSDCLKECVKKKLHTFRVLDHPDATVTLGQPRSYLSDVIGLLKCMFITDPARRSSSESVVNELRMIAANHEEDNDPNSDILRFMRSLGPVPLFKELGYWHNEGIVAFYCMSDIKLKIIDHTIVDCRLQLFRKNGAVHVRIRYGDRYMNDLSHTFDTKDSSFCPIYLFDHSSRFACCLKDKHHERTFYFGSDKDLIAFQTAIMRHKPGGLKISEVTLHPKKGDNETYRNLHDPNLWGRCQIWQSENPQYVPAQTSIGPLSPRRTSGGPISVLFFSPKAVFGIPLQDGKKMVREKYDSYKEASRKVVFDKQGGFAEYFHYMKSEVSGLLSARGEAFCPAIPLSSDWLKKDESKRANKVDIVFPDHQELLKFKQQISIANNENHHKEHEIPWKDSQG